MKFENLDERNYVTAKSLARLLRKSDRTIKRLASDGTRPKAIPGKGYDLAECVRSTLTQLQDLRQRQGGRPDPLGDDISDDPTQAEAKITRYRREIAEAKTAEVRAAREAGETISVDEVLQITATGFALLKNRWQTQCGRMAHQLAAMDDPADIRAALLDDTNVQLLEASQRFGQFAKGIDGE